MCQITDSKVMIHKDYIAGTFLQPLINYLDEQKLDAPELEAEMRALVSEASLDINQFCYFLEELYKLKPAPALGIKLGLSAKPEHFGVIGHLLCSCNTLSQALIRYKRYQTVVQTALTSKVKEVKGNVEIKWTQRVANTPLAHEFSVAAFVSLYQHLIGKKLAPYSVGFPAAKPDDHAVYEAILGCPVHFEYPTLMTTIPVRFMSMRIDNSDPKLRQILEKQAMALMEPHAPSSDEYSDFFETLQQHIWNGMQDGQFSAEEVAGKMGYSLRSFYRKLSENGHSYRSILDDARLRLAKRYLSDFSLSHTEVALLLGYSEQSSFIRAFRNWMGITPGEYREQIAEKRDKKD